MYETFFSVIGMSTPDPTMLTIIGTTITGLSTAIGVLWKTIMSHISKLEEKLNECEDDRKALHVEQKNLWMVIAKHAGKGIEELKGDKE